MLQKLTITVLIVTVVGAIGLGIYDANQSEEPQTDVLRTDATDTEVATLTPISNENPTEIPTNIPNIPNPTEAEVAIVPTVAPVEPVQNSQNMVGDVWQGSGVVVALDDVGMTLDSGVYVEIAPPFYWADVPLQVGDRVIVNGFSNGEQIHTQTLNLDGAVYAFRTADGQPLWSGGADNSNGNGQQGSNEQQVPLSEWENYSGTLTVQGNNGLTLQTQDGQLITLQLGQPRFRESQNITLTTGDWVEVSGYWQADQFRVGTLTQTATGKTLLLLDPNGRPLWGGPGRSEGTSSNGNGNAGSGSNGNGYRGGRNNATEEANQ